MTTNHDIETIHNYLDPAANGTSLQGYVETTYSHLVATLGEPTYSDPSGDDKVYDWKNYGRDGRTETNWHIGGHDPAVVALVQQALA